jgi:hypothetical protein
MAILTLDVFQVQIEGPTCTTSISNLGILLGSIVTCREAYPDVNETRMAANKGNVF